MKSMTSRSRLITCMYGYEYNIQAQSSTPFLSAPFESMVLLSSGSYNKERGADGCCG